MGAKERAGNTYVYIHCDHRNFIVLAAGLGPVSAQLRQLMGQTWVLINTQNVFLATLKNYFH